MICRTTRPGFLCIAAIIAAAATAAVAVPSVASADPAPSQSQINSTQTQVSALETTIAQDQQKTAALSQQYDSAVQQVQQVQAALAATTKSLQQTQQAVDVDKARLAHDAVNAYVYAAPATGITSLFTSSANQSDARKEYESTVIGDVSSAEAALQTEEAKLAATKARQQAEEQQATDALNQVQSLRTANQNATQATEATLQQVKGQLAQEVAAYAAQQAAEEAAAAAAAAAARQQAAAEAAARAAAQAASVATQLGSTGTAAAATDSANRAAGSASGSPTNVSGSATGSSGGMAAVQAAESELGVPYVWGGESPGSGFDCSGLTQWAWARAGVSIPRTSEAQWGALPHVSLSSLQPGDLLFYYNLDGDNQVDHVAMYVGSGPYGSQTIIQAPHTGSTVSYAPLFTGGLIGAGRP